jgi:hypothetical protein
MLIRHQVCKRNIEEKTKAKVVIIERGENLREWEGGGDHWWGKDAMIKQLGKIFLMHKEIQGGGGGGAWKVICEEEPS